MARYAEDDPDFVWEEPPPGSEWLTEYDAEEDVDYPDLSPEEQGLKERPRRGV